METMKKCCDSKIEIKVIIMIIIIITIITNNNNWLQLITTLLSWSVEILVTNVIESMKLSKSKQVAGYIFACCIALGPSLPLLAGFVVQKLLPVSLCQLANTEKGCYWKYGCNWHQLRTLRRNLGRCGWGDYWCFLTSSSCCSHHPTVIL